MEKKDFFNLVKSREYMMKLHYEDKIPKKAKFISILGEIKSSFFLVIQKTFKEQIMKLLLI